jgi:hypothetical protein
VETAALGSRGALRALSRASQRPSNQRGLVLEDAEEPSERSSSQAAEGALVSLATSLKDAQSAASWYWQRGWIEQSFKDSKGRSLGLPR